MGLEAVEAHQSLGIKITSHSIGLTPLYRLAYAIQSEMAQCTGCDVFLAYLKLWYDSEGLRWPRPERYGCLSLQHLLSEQLSLFFVLENSKYRGNPRIRVRDWETDNKAGSALSPSTGERADDDGDVSETEDVLMDSIGGGGRITPDIIGHVNRKAEAASAAKPLSFKPFRIEPRRPAGGMNLANGQASQRYGSAFPHSLQARPARFADAVDAVEGTGDGSRFRGDSGHAGGGGELNSGRPTLDVSHLSRPDEQVRHDNFIFETNFRVSGNFL